MEMTDAEPLARKRAVEKNDPCPSQPFAVTCMDQMFFRLAVRREVRDYFFSVAASAAFFWTSTESLLTVLATLSDRVLANRPLGSHPGAIVIILPPLAIRKFVGIVFVSKMFQASPLLSTA